MPASANSARAASYDVSVTGGAGGWELLGEAGRRGLYEAGEHRARAIDVAVHGDARCSQHPARRAVRVDRLHDERLALGGDRVGHLTGRRQLRLGEAGLVCGVTAEVAGQQHTVDLLGGNQDLDTPGIAPHVLLPRAGEVDRVGHRRLRPQRGLELAGERAGQHRGLQAGRIQRIGGHRPVPAPVGEDHGPASGQPPGPAHGGQQVGHLGRVLHPERTHGRARGVDHHRGRGERARVGGRAAHRRLGAAGSQQDQRLAGVAQRPGGVEEGPAVDDVLGVDGHGPGPLVVQAGMQEVDEAEVRLVAERDEPGHAQAAVGQQAGEVEHQVAALAEHRHVTGREHGVRQLEPGRGVDDPEAVGTDQDRASSASDRQRLGLEPGPLRTCLGESRSDPHDRPGPGGDGVGHRGHEALGRDAEHGQVDAEVVCGGGRLPRTE